jgi:hypothetical protein
MDLRVCFTPFFVPVGPVGGPTGTVTSSPRHLQTKGFKLSRGEFMPYLFIFSFLLQNLFNYLAFYKKIAYI